jgi:DNA-binding NarL/FixJ family response regulator
MTEFVFGQKVIVIQSVQGQHQPYSSDGSILCQLLSTCGFVVSTIGDCTQLPDNYANCLVFFDCEHEPDPLALFSQYHGEARWFLFNLSCEQIREVDAIIAGVNGVFYRHDKPELVLKGLYRITKNDIWFKRSSINQALRRLSSVVPKQRLAASSTLEPALSQLTKREKVILHLVSRGAPNQDIADELHISVNTVKTHIYSIFRKTHSRNRIELVAWSQQHKLC